MKILPALFAFCLSSLLLHAEDAEYDAYLKEWSGKCDALLADWKAHPGKPGEELRHQLVEAGIRAERPEIVDMVAAGTMDSASLEIKAPEKTRDIPAKVVHSLGKPPEQPYNGPVLDIVFRRMTADSFEAWTPKHGWLFDGKGRLINEARPPRHDGIGREWHGAFLPDGRWVTTDLWEWDRTLTFFSKRGKWLKEIPSEKLAPPGEHDGNGHDIIGWARCDRKGTGWVVSVGSEEGRAVVFVKPQGNAVELGEKESPYDYCYPRDLEPKGDYTGLLRPSDDGKDQVNFTEAGHGYSVGFPHYQNTSGKIYVNIAGGNHNFGFLPASPDVFISADEYLKDKTDDAKTTHKTWFFDVDGACRGWVPGRYLADAPDGKGLWIVDENHVVELDAALKPQSQMRFLIEGKKAEPVKLFTDLRLGFFNTSGKVVLARW